MASAPADSLNPSVETGWAAEYAHTLLADAGVAALAQPLNPKLSRHPAAGWLGSGLMRLTGSPATGASLCPVPLTSCAEGALAALAALAPAGDFRGLDAAMLLSERAVLMGLERAGSVSPGGACHLLATRSGHLAVNLPRASDWELLPAWLEAEPAATWAALAAQLATRSDSGALVARGRELGLAVAAVQPPAATAPAWQQVVASGPPRAPAATPLVLDLSSLWAGPLCAHLLQRAGARVIKVESRQRLDGARRGNADFYHLLNAGKESLLLDLNSGTGVAQLLALIRQADIVIEATRPRALQQLGIHAEALVQECPGLTWLSITAYGRQVEQGNWVGFGDDTAVAAGLSWVMQQVSGAPIFCGDAIADPLTGLHAALAGWAGHLHGGGQLIALALSDVVGHCIGFKQLQDTAAWQARQQHWQNWLAQSAVDATPVRPRFARSQAAAAGADTAALVQEFGLPC